MDVSFIRELYVPVQPTLKSRKLAFTAQSSSFHSPLNKNTFYVFFGFKSVVNKAILLYTIDSQS